MLQLSMIYVIGDTQSKEGVRNPLVVIAHHICAIKPSHVVHLGDHWDLPSLSLWDKGKRSHTINASYVRDMAAGNTAMQEFWKIIKEKWPEGLEKCVWILLRGNHEERRAKALEKCEPQYIELIESVGFDCSNWDIIVPFLEVFRLHNIEFSHYFTNTGSAYPISSARQLLLKRHTSCIVGHQQGFDYAEMLRGSDKVIQAIICGSTYYHKEDYKTHNNHHYRGTLVLSNLESPTGFDFARFSLELLDRWYK